MAIVCLLVIKYWLLKHYNNKNYWFEKKYDTVVRYRVSFRNARLDDGTPVSSTSAQNHKINSRFYDFFLWIRIPLTRYRYEYYYHFYYYYYYCARIIICILFYLYLLSVIRRNKFYFPIIFIIRIHAPSMFPIARSNIIADPTAQLLSPILHYLPSPPSCIS